MLLREPKRLRIDIFNDMLEKSRTKVKQQKSGKISRTDSDVSLSESLYDSLFSEDDGKTDNSERSRNRTRNKSLDMFEVVTACLDNMAAKTGITKIQRQSHMDRWLQKAKSKTPEKTQAKPLAPQVKVEEKKETKVTNSKKKKNLSRSRVAVNKPYSLRKSMTESQNMIQFPNDHDYSKNVVVVTDSDHNSTDTDSCKNFASQEHTGIVASIESPSTKPEESEKDVDTIENEGTTGDKDVKVENPTVILPKINGSCETSEGESVDESSQNSNIVNTAASPGNNNKTKGDNSAHVSFYQDEVEEACENRANTPDPVTIREQMISPVYEDSFDEVQYSRALIDRNHTENEEITPNCKPVEATADSQDEMTNEDSTLESNEPSSMSVDEDGDYKPDYETDSQTDDNCSSNGAPLTNDSILDTQQDIYDDSISDVPIKKNVAIEIDSSVSHGEFNNEITNDVPSKLNKEFILDRYGADLDLDHVTEVLEIKQISNGLDSEVENSNQFSFSKKLEEDKILDRNEDAIKFPISISNISDEISNHDMVESITRNGPLNGNLNVKEIDMNTAKEVHIPVFKPDMIKENGFHNEEAHMNGDIDLDSISIISEDSVTSTKSESKRKLRSKDKKPEDPLENAEFVKYLELRQDAIMDENPELTQNEIVAYLYKTWLYEENSKSDDKKNDDLRELNMVKGLNEYEPEQKKKPRERDQTRQRNSHKKNLSLNKNMMQRFLHRKTRSEKNVEYTDVERNFQINEDSDEVDEVPSPAYEPLDDIKPESSQSSSSVQETIETNETEVALDSSTPTLLEDKNVYAETRGLKKDDDFKVTLTITDEQEVEKSKEISPINTSNVVEVTCPQEPEKSNFNHDIDADSIDSEDSEAPLIRSKLRSKAKKENCMKEDVKIKDEEADAISITSGDSEMSITKRKKKFPPKKVENALDNPDFVKYLELRQDDLIDENPELSQEEIVSYLYQTWLYEESEFKKNDDIDPSVLVKGLEDAVQQPKKVKRKVKTEKETEKEDRKERETDTDKVPKDKPKRKVIKPYYNEEYSDVEEELEVFPIFNPKNKQVGENAVESEEPISEGNDIDEVELYFEQLAQPKPNVFKGLIREKVCEICEMTGNLVKCKGCNGMFHVDCVNKEDVEVENPVPVRGRKKKKRLGRKPKNSDEFDSQDEKSQDVSEESMLVEELIEPETCTVDAETLEAQLEAKMKELLGKENAIIDYDSYSSDDGCDWSDTLPGKCEIIDIKLKSRRSNDADYSNFKCKNCQKYDTPVCFVCKSAVYKSEMTLRQKCHVAHCHKYYHLKCLDHWPQTQFNGGEPSKTNKKINEYFEALTCPRHVCHTCVSDDPRGCKTRFSGDKLARCVRCPATYHSFTKCLPAGTLVLTASHIICPRHYEHR